MAGAGGVHRLPRQIPLKQAMGMILTGRRVPAQEGKELGFVNEVVPAGQALEGAKRWAKLILECSPMSVRASKQAVDRTSVVKGKSVSVRVALGGRSSIKKKK